jgi:hypothetical protein
MPPMRPARSPDEDGMGVILWLLVFLAVLVVGFVWFA